MTSLNKEDDYCLALRQELKEWEQAFAAANNGHKPERADIKKNPGIAARFKEYGRIKAPSSSITKDAPQSRPPSKKRKSTIDTQSRDISLTTPRKIQKRSLSTIPSNHPSIVDPYDAPFAIRALNLSPIRQSIGPTPQKDGKVLGIFDLLSDTEVLPSATTPSRQSNGVPDTPRGISDKLTISPANQAHARTPASSGKRFLLDKFLTPPRNHHNSTMTPKRSISKLEFDTPVFLKRTHPTRQQSFCGLDGLKPIGEDISPVKLCLPPAPPKRGLSSMLASLRKMEDDRLDDDMDVLRELENEAIGEAKHRQRQEAGSRDENIEDTTGRVYKKKGQKRTTKRITMRPVARPARPAPIVIPAAVIAEDSASDDRPNSPTPDEDPALPPSPSLYQTTTITSIAAPESPSRPTPTTPINLARTKTTPRSSSQPAFAADAIFDPDDDPSEIDEAIQAKDAALVAAEMAKLSGTKTGAGGVVERTKRKIKQSAHQNFRRLKIRGSNGAKGNSGKGRFGRGRR